MDLKKPYILRRARQEDDAQIASLIRNALEQHGLALPGTVYYDEILDHLSGFYDNPDIRCEYFVIRNGEDLAGSAGYYPFDGFENCAELHKIYVDPLFQGEGLGCFLLNLAENRARAAGYTSMYIETHSCLEKAVNLYLRRGYERIERPDSVSHGAMNVFLKKDLV